MSTPPEQPGDANAPEPQEAIEAQLDNLLSKIEDAEPGTLDPQVLPNPAQPTAQPPQQATSADLEIDALLNQPPNETPTEAPTEAEIDALLNAPPVDTAPAEPEQEQMLDALNTALQDLPKQPPADEPSEERSVEEQLEQEISALMSAEPEASAAPATHEAAALPASTTTVIDEEEDDALVGSFESPESLAALEAAQSPAPSTADQIAMEIEGLLDTDQEPTATAEPSETAINELDQMLAQEIDDDDELAGDFQSVEDLTAGIQVQDSSQALEDDEHAATARDVAAELDSQPEDLPAPPATAGEDPFKELDEAADKIDEMQAQPQRRAALQASDVNGWLETAKDRLLVACYWINWPARRFLSAEWRANLGYIALLNLFFGVGLWVVRILF